MLQAIFHPLMSHREAMTSSNDSSEIKQQTDRCKKLHDRTIYFSRYEIQTHLERSCFLFHIQKALFDKALQ